MLKKKNRNVYHIFRSGAHLDSEVFGDCILADLRTWCWLCIWVISMWST